MSTKTPSKNMMSFSEFRNAIDSYCNIQLLTEQNNKNVDNIRDEVLLEWGPREIQNEVITVRCPNVFKQKLTSWAETKGMGLSEAVRLACVEIMKR